MAVIAGIDEAGYGPLMGPLVMSAAAFRVPDACADADLWNLFQSAVTRNAPGKTRRIRVADSKAVFDRSAGLGSIEKHLLPFAALLGDLPATLRRFVGWLGKTDAEGLASYPWYDGADWALPRKVTRDSVMDRAKALEACLTSTASAFCSARVEVLDVVAFNREIAACNNKAVALPRCLARLMTSLWEKFGHEKTFLTVDKQGGRNRYDDFLSATFPFKNIAVQVESAETSEYVIADGERHLAVAFRAKADRHCLPTALASMFSKYVRELFLERLNAYWMQRVPGLAPTAGYTTDGRRFLAEIEAARKAEGIPLYLLMRCR